MKLSLKHLRKIIKEEFILGNAIPDFVLTQALDKTVADLRASLMKHIQSYVANSQEQRVMAEKYAEEFLQGFKDDMREVFEKRLTQFIDKF